jgi:hypothetical protein
VYERRRKLPHCDFFSNSIARIIPKVHGLGRETGFYSSAIRTAIFPTADCVCSASNAAITSSNLNSCATTGLMACAAANAANSATASREKAVWPRTDDGYG